MLHRQKSADFLKLNLTQVLIKNHLLIQRCLVNVYSSLALLLSSVESGCTKIHINFFTYEIAYLGTFLFKKECQLISFINPSVQFFQYCFISRVEL